MMDTSSAPSAAAAPQQLFIYGTLCALPLLAWAITGDSANVDELRSMCRPAIVHGYSRRKLHHKDFPAVIEAKNDSVEGYIVTFKNASQRKKLDDFEGELYQPVSVVAEARCSPDHGPVTSVDVDMYLWNGDVEIVSTEPWSLETFIEERLEDWLDLVDGVELVGDQ